MDRNKMKKKMIIMVFFLVVGIMVFGFVGSVKASDYYVAIDGNDTTGDGSFNNPWTSPEKAWRMADAGDTVYFRGGTYIISSQIWTKYYGCTGTEINPITFCNYPEECVIFNGTNLGVVFRIEKNWNIIKGINCTGGHSFFNFGYDLSVDGGRVENCIAYNYSGGDNVGFVSIGGASNITVENCNIVGPGLRSEGVHANTAGVIAFGADGLKVLHNQISNVPIGIYYKHANAQTNTGIEIAHNYIKNTDRYSMELNCNYGYIHDNLIGSDNAGFRINEANGSPGGDYNTISHNTIYNSEISLSCDTQSGDPLPGAIHNILRDNIITNVLYLHQYSSMAHNSTLDYNLYSQPTAVKEFDVNYNLADWQLHYEQDNNSLSGTPTFVGGGSPLLISDFALTSGSIGKNAASDGKDMGADISLVGVQGGENVNISGVSSSNVGDGDSIVISGDGFGGDGPTIYKWDDFEGDTHVLNNTIGNGDGDIPWTYHEGNATCSEPKLSNNGSRTTGGKFVRGTWDYTDGRYLCVFHYQRGTTLSPVYISFYMRWDYWGTYVTNNEKFWRLCNIDGAPYFRMVSNPVHPDAVASVAWDLQGGDSLVDRYKPRFSEEQWARFELYAVESDQDVANGTIILSRQVSENSTFENLFDVTNHKTRTVSTHWNAVQFGSYISLSEGSQYYHDFDDIYIASSRARVEIGNNSIWNSCTHREIQIPTAWLDDSITININQGSFPNGTAYLFAVDENGNVSNGYPINFAGELPIISGDLNNDGKVNIQDLQLCINVILGAESNPEIVSRAKKVVAPLDVCNELDLQGIVNIVLGR